MKEKDISQLDYKSEISIRIQVINLLRLIGNIAIKTKNSFPTKKNRIVDTFES